MAACLYNNRQLDAVVYIRVADVGVGVCNEMDNMLQFMKLVGQLKVSEIRIDTNVLRVNLCYINACLCYSVYHEQDGCTEILNSLRVCLIICTECL